MSSINSYTVPSSAASDDNSALYEDGVYSDETANFASSSPVSAADAQFSGSISSKMHAAGEQGWRDKALLDKPGPILVSFLMSIVMLMWFAVWAFTFTSTYVVAYAGHMVPNPADPNDPTADQYTTEPFTASEKVAVVFLIFSLYWTSQVFRNISHVTTAGTVASWWLVSDIERPTLGAFKRAMTTSFGTICAGSLVVAIVDTFIWLLNQLQDVGAAVMRCLLQLFSGILKWLNKYAFVEAAMYGYSFLDSARAVRTLMSLKFWELVSSASTTFLQIINDSLIRMVFVMGNMVSGAVAGLVGAAWAQSISIPMPGAIGVLAFVVGLALSTLIMIVLDSAVATSYVVWAEDPSAMLRNRPEHYNRIAEAAKLMYPTEYQQAVAARTEMSQPAP